MYPRLHVKLVFVVFVVFAALALPAERALAEPFPVSVSLEAAVKGAEIIEQWEITFPTFNLSFFDFTHLRPGFCFECDSGAQLPFTQSTGPFSGTGIIGNGNELNASVSGNFSFVGPTVTLQPDELGFFRADEPVQFSGALNVTQGQQVLFQGMLIGSGTGTIVYENKFGGHRLGGYEYHVDAVSATPEPAPIVLLSSSLVLLIVSRRRKHLVVVGND